MYIFFSKRVFLLKKLDFIIIYNVQVIKTIKTCINAKTPNFRCFCGYKAGFSIIVTFIKMINYFIAYF